MASSSLAEPSYDDPPAIMTPQLSLHGVEVCPVLSGMALAPTVVALIE